MQPVCESAKGKKEYKNPLNSFFFCCPEQWNFRSTLWLRKENIISELRNYSRAVIILLEQFSRFYRMICLISLKLMIYSSAFPDTFLLPNKKPFTRVKLYTDSVWFNYLYKITPFESIFWQNTTTCMIHSTLNTNPKITDW